MRKLDLEYMGGRKLTYKPLKPAESNGCNYQHLTSRGIDYCLRSNAWLCRALVEQGRCPSDREV